MVGSDLIIQMTENPYELKLKICCSDNLQNLKRYYEGRSFPSSIEIFPTNICNLNCPWCISKQYHNKDTLNIDKLKKFLKDYKELGGKAITWAGGGEPTQYPHFQEAVEYAHRLGLDQGMMTNGVFSEKLIDMIGNTMIWIRISLDTTDKKLYQNIKGVDGVDIVKRNVKKLSKYPIKVNTNVNLAPELTESLIKTAKDSRDWGIDVFQLRPLLPCPADNRVYIPENLDDIISALKILQNDRFFLSVSYDKFNELKKQRTYKSCRYHNFIFVLNANGDVSVCAYRLYEDDFVFGNINKHSIKEIWNSEKRKQVIRNTSNMDFSKCQVCCKGHELNKYLHAIELTNKLKDRRFL